MRSKNKVSKEEEKIRKGKLKNFADTSDGTKKSLGIVKVQSEEAVFYHKNGRYYRVLILKNAEELAENKEKFNVCSFLADELGCFVRVTSILRPRKDGKVSIIRFLLLGIEAKDYFEAEERLDEISKKAAHYFETNFDMEVMVHGINSVLAEFLRNYLLPAKDIDHRQSLKKKEDWGKVFSQEVKKEEEFLKIGDHYALLYFAKDFPKKNQDVFSFFLSLGLTCYQALDLESYRENERRDYMISENEKYFSDLNRLAPEGMSNCGYFLTLLSSDKEELRNAREEVLTFFGDAGLLLASPIGYEEEVFFSLATLGLFHSRCMRNVSFSVSNKLLL